MLKNAIFSWVLLFSWFTQAQAAAPFIDGFSVESGVHYKKAPTPHPTAKKQVLEVFYYGCPHCYKLEPSIHEWLKTKPKDVEFVRMPAVLNNPNWIFMARVFYTAKELGILDKFHEAYFKAIQRDHQRIFDLNALAKFVAPMGVKAEDYKAMFKSFKVDQDVQHARRMTEDFGINGVPSLVVNGQYVTDVPMTGSEDNLWKVVNFLLEK
jgi:thiol:disulfide interchange protein DsbA